METVGTTSGEVNEDTQLLGNKPINYKTTKGNHPQDSSISTRDEEPFHPKIYKRRWWILFAFCIASVAQSALWNTWSPLLDAVLIAFEWPDSFVAMLPAASDIGFIVCAFPLMYVVETTDLRHGVIIAVSLLVFSSAAWNIALPTGQEWLIVVGALLNGITACITMAAPPLLSVIWFPMSERTTATAFAAMSGYTGTALAFITSPYISGANVTANDVKHRASLSSDFLTQLRTGIHNVVYFDTALAAASFLMVIIYFPAKPPKPPSKSQTKPREDFWKGIKHLATNPHFWLLNIAFNVPNGTFNAWLPLCSVNFRSLGVDEATAGWIGFSSMMASVVGSVAMSMVIDRAKRKMKLVCLVLGVLALAIFVILVCIQEHYIHIPEQSVTAVLYTLCICVSLCVNSVIPLYYELGCECAFPVHEGLACSFFALTNNLFGMIFFVLFLAPSLAADTKWMTWTCLGASALTPPLLLLMKEHYYRLDIEATDDNNGQAVVET